MKFHETIVVFEEIDEIVPLVRVVVCQCDATVEFCLVPVVHILVDVTFHARAKALILRELCTGTHLFNSLK